VVSSTNGELQGDDQVGGQSNAPITSPTDVDNTETTKYVLRVVAFDFWCICCGRSGKVL